MSTLRKIIFIAFVTCAVFAAIWAYFIIKKGKAPAFDGINLIPDSCEVYLNTNNYFGLSKKINSQSLVTEKLKYFTEPSQIIKFISLFDSIFSASDLKWEIDESLIHAAFYPKNKFLFVSNIKQSGNDLTVKNLFKINFQCKISEGDIQTFKLNDYTFYFLLHQGNMVLSNSSLLIQKAINIKCAKFVKSKNYLDSKLTLSEDNGLNLFINHSIYSGKKWHLKNIIKNGFSSGNVVLEPAEIKINGYCKPDSNEVLFSLSNQEPQEAEKLFLYFPPNTISFKAYGISNFQEVLKKSKGHPEETYWKEKKRTSLFNISEEFYANIKNQLFHFKTLLISGGITGIEIRDTLLALNHLKLMSDSTEEKNGFTFYKLSAIPLQLFEPFVKASAKWAVFYNEHIFFSDKKGDLEIYLNGINHTQKSNSDESFEKYHNDELSEKYNFIFYSSPKYDEKESESFYSDETLSGISPWKSFRHFSFIVSNDQSQIRYRMQLSHEAENNVKGFNTLWTATLDTTSNKPVYEFRNHLTNEVELLLHDDKNTLYLMNAKGILIWKKKCEEEIISAIYLVDAFKNSKYQILFNTNNHLHLIDRNGNYLKGFPVKLPAMATSGLTLLDYEKNKDYRIFISCKNKTIYNYGISGVFHDGFEPVITEKNVELPIQYVKVGGSDYLVTVDEEGKIYTFSRKGQGRIGLKNRTIQNCRSFYVDATNEISTTNIIYFDDVSSLINKISFLDKKEIIKLDVEPSPAGLDFALVDNNRMMDMIITKSDKLFVYTINGDLLFEKNYGENLNSTRYFSDESRTIYYSWSKKDKIVFIFEQHGQKTRTLESNNLPLFSNLFNDNKRYFVTVSGKELMCLPLD